MASLSSQSRTMPALASLRIIAIAPSVCPMPSTGLHEARYSKSFPGSTALYSGSFLRGRISSEALRCSSMALACSRYPIFMRLSSSPASHMAFRICSSVFPMSLIFRCFRNSSSALHFSERTSQSTVGLPSAANSPVWVMLKYIDGPPYAIANGSAWKSHSSNPFVISSTGVLVMAWNSCCTRGDTATTAVAPSSTLRSIFLCHLSVALVICKCLK